MDRNARKYDEVDHMLYGQIKPQTEAHKEVAKIYGKHYDELKPQNKAEKTSC